MRYLSFDEILRIHDRMIVDFGGEAGILSEGSLENCVALPMMSVFGTETSKSVWSKAAALMHCIEIRHPFVDGNKRTGWTAARVFLLLNGFGLNASTENAETTVRRVAQGEMEPTELAEWMRVHSYSI